MIVVGVDPSTAPDLALVSLEHGWMAFADKHQTATRETKTKWRPVGELIFQALVEWQVLYGIDHVAMEKIGVWSGQGLVSSAEFVGAMRLVEGIAIGMGLRVQFYTPAAWKRAMKLTGDKDQSRGVAARLWPERAMWLRQKQDHDRAEAALLGWYSIQKEARLI